MTAKMGEGSWVQVEKRVNSVWGRQVEMDLHMFIMGISVKAAFYPCLGVFREQAWKDMLQTLECTGDETMQPGLQSFDPGEGLSVEISLASLFHSLCSPWPSWSHVVSVAFPDQSLYELEKEMVLRREINWWVMVRRALQCSEEGPKGCHLMSVLLWTGLYSSGRDQAGDM